MSSLDSFAPARRPGLVTLLVVLVVIGGILSILAGIVVIVAWNSPAESELVVETGSSNAGLIVGIISIAVGLLYLFVARGLARGNKGARLVVAIVSVLSVASGLYLALTQDGNARVSGWSSVVWGVVILAILYSPKANAFFATR
jgi:hypothetical protein